MSHWSQIPAALFYRQELEENSDILYFIFNLPLYLQNILFFPNNLLKFLTKRVETINLNKKIGARGNPLRDNKGTKSEFCPDVPTWGKFLPVLARSSASICLIFLRCSRTSISLGRVWSSLISKSSQGGRGGKLWKNSSAADGSSAPAGWKNPSAGWENSNGKGAGWWKTGND